MAGAARKTKVSEITERINVMGRNLRDGETLDLMTWKRLFNELEALENADQFGRALLLQAVLWEFRNEPDKSVRLFNLYAGRIGKDREWHFTRANMAPMLGDVKPIIEMLGSAYPDGDIDGLSKVVVMCNHAGMFMSAQRAINDIERLDPARAARIRDDWGFLEGIGIYFNCHQVDEIEVAKRVVTASRVVLDSGFRLTKYTVGWNEYGITFEFMLDADIERLVDINLAISDALAEKFEGTLSDHLSIGVTPYEEAA
jgi:hypothetical protein